MLAVISNHQLAPDTEIGLHLPPDEELAVQALLRQLDFPARRLRIIDAALGRIALGSRRSSR